MLLQPLHKETPKIIVNNAIREPRLILSDLTISKSSKGLEET